MMKRLLVILLMTACHPAPALAHEADLFLPQALVDEMNNDAKVVCDASSQGDSDTCLDVVFDSYLEAVEMGARETEEKTLVDILKLADVQTGCVDNPSQSCKIYTPLWGSYYVVGEANKAKVLNGTGRDNALHP
ncbi:hypothetical protein NDAWWUGD_CDS0162 [Salmonella phage SeKF_80]